MELEDSLKSEHSEILSSIVQNISNLSLTLYSAEDDCQTFVFPQSADRPDRQKNGELSPAACIEIPDFPESKIEPSGENCDESRDEKKLKVIKVEVEFLKQSIDYLRNVLAQKSLKVQKKDEKIEKLEKVIEKQKKKLKDLKNRMMFQGSKLTHLEARIPSYFEMLEKSRSIEKKNEVGPLEKISIKKLKLSSSSPRIKNQALQPKHFSPR